jgi:hypothetical protein
MLYSKLWKFTAIHFQPCVCCFFHSLGRCLKAPFDSEHACRSAIEYQTASSDEPTRPMIRNLLIPATTSGTQSCISCWIMSIFACSRLNVQSSMWIWDWTFRALCGYAGLSSYLPLLFSEYNPPSYGGRRKDSFRCLLILSKLFFRFHMTSNTKCQTSCLTRGINTRRSLALDLYVGCTCTSLSVVTLPFIGFCEWWLQHL